MKKKVLLSMALAGTLLLSSTALVSCSDDDSDEPKNEDKTVENLKVQYEVDFPDVVYQYCDVSVQYVDANGNTVKVLDDITGDFSKELLIPASSAEHTYTLTATLSLKSTYPEVDNNRIYEVGHDLDVELTEYNRKGEKLQFSNSESEANLKVKGYDLLNYLGNMTTREYTVSAAYPF